MWSCAFWRIFKIMMPHDQSRLRPDQLHPRHTRITIRIDEVNIPCDKNVVIIRAARRNDERRENCDFDDCEDSANHCIITNPGSAIGNPKFQVEFGQLSLKLDVGCWMFARYCAVGL